MPFTLNKPQEIVTNSVTIESFNVYGLTNDKGPFLMITCLFGTVDGYGAFTQTDRKVFNIKTSNVQKYMMASITSGTAYSNLKKMLFHALLEEGHIPAGTLT